jgi:small conductance mechanosensitive channel
MESHPDMMKTPSPFLGVSELAYSSVNLAMRAFTEPDLY